MKKELSDIDTLHKEILKNKTLISKKKKSISHASSDKYHIDLNEESDLKHTVTVRIQRITHGEFC